MTEHDHAGNAHAVLIPEIPFDLDKIAAKLRARDSEGRLYSIVVVAEGAQALIHKPNDVEELCATVQRLVGGDSHAAG